MITKGISRILKSFSLVNNNIKFIMSPSISKIVRYALSRKKKNGIARVSIIKINVPNLPRIVPVVFIFALLS